MTQTTELTELREHVRKRYAAAARNVGDTCCATDCCVSDAGYAAGLYSEGELGEVPTAAALASLGCGNPMMVAELRQGETVLDLGSGGGLDVLLSARRVGPTGKAYGVDMTTEMLELARRNRAEAGVDNVDFLEGLIEDVPLPDSSVDVIISNCVINLSTDKPSVFDEMYRLLRPGGRIGITDIVAEDHLTPMERAQRGSYVGCIAGALSFSEYRQGLSEVGFIDIEVVPTHVAVAGFHSSLVRAAKPA